MSNFGLDPSTGTSSDVYISPTILSREIALNTVSFTYEVADAAKTG